MKKLDEVVPALLHLKAVVVVPTVADHPTSVESVTVPSGGPAYLYSDFLNSAEDIERPLLFEQLEPDHPVYILFSSGTTGSKVPSIPPKRQPLTNTIEPKCICHGAIGTLIQHKKEHFLQSDMKPGDVFFQFTTVTWMMYVFLLF